MQSKATSSAQVVQANARAEFERVTVKLGAQSGAEYEILIGENMLRRIGDIARQVASPHARRAFIISNETVFALYGAIVQRNLRQADFKVAHWPMKDGERYKSLRSLEQALRCFAEAKLERSDVVVALGGGVCGDLAGLAAALYLRGVAYIQAPTTLLAQIDSSVGGKTAVNTAFGKNSIGAFHHPRGVLIDTATLQTLPARELTAGWCEAVKQGAIAGRALFADTCEFLGAEQKLNQLHRRGATQSGVSLEVTNNNSASGNRIARLNKLIAAQVAFKASIVRGDEREDAARTDARSRRILNFGHTVAHALELVTDYKRFRHGEAVGYGMLVAAEISARLGLLDVAEAKDLRCAVQLAGRLPRADNLDETAIVRAISLDKKSVGGSVKWILLEDIGRPVIVDGREVPARILRAALRQAFSSNSLEKRTR